MLTLKTTENSFCCVAIKHPFSKWVVNNRLCLHVGDICWQDEKITCRELIGRDGAHTVGGGQQISRTNYCDFFQDNFFLLAFPRGESNKKVSSRKEWNSWDRLAQMDMQPLHKIIFYGSRFDSAYQPKFLLPRQINLR